MTNVKLTVAYDGRNYHGFQVQPGLVTIQGVLEEKISSLTGEKVRVNVSGRTDAGVHALGQVINFQTNSPLPVENWVSALNSRLPKEIRVLNAREVQTGFHARYSSRSKHYRYLMVVEGTGNPIVGEYAWLLGKELDYNPMREAAKLILGEHDFQAFQTAGSSAKTTVRRVIKSELSLSKVGFPPEGKGLQTLVYDIAADGFLYNMVRNIVGWLVRVGEGSLTLEEAFGLLESKDRSLIGRPAPAMGLWLMNVQY